ncbi:MAG TPA: bifunctional enoyl-CoA hydratase/phosphate acetyltransferase [Spirochaetota bacterium]|nr:bifunctional enoyl-CoA hydratase/phosphate acetyltransferase [Spirochaetota bacterium]HQP48284.1 bifunctional enoyl-CoA hydratase/phosphate acetyltransferase [Spirochaetota bacterium]
MITKLSDIFVKIGARKDRKKIAVVAAHDEHVLDAVTAATKQGIVDAVLVGDRERIREIADIHQFDISACEIIDEKENIDAAALAVRMIHEGTAHVLMKGLVDTPTFLRPILQREGGLRTGDILSSVAIFELKGYHKIFALTDGGLNIAPDLKTKVSILRNGVFFMNRLGIEMPKVAVLGALEFVNESMTATIDGALLSKMAQRGQLKHCIVDGPLSFDNAISAESARFKGIESEVAGDADILLAPNIETANVLYKSFVYLAKASPAAIIVGASVPVILTSRADSEVVKLNSISLAASVDMG